MRPPLPLAPIDDNGFVASTIEDTEPVTYEGRIWTDMSHSTIAWPYGHAR
ncbi:MAG: hypothetical protein WD960_09205 [Gemmatimonadota bacterium]